MHVSLSFFIFSFFLPLPNALHHFTCTPTTQQFVGNQLFAVIEKQTTGREEGGSENISKSFFINFPTVVVVTLTVYEWEQMGTSGERGIESQWAEWNDEKITNFICKVIRGSLARFSDEENEKSLWNLKPIFCVCYWLASLLSVCKPTSAKWFVRLHWMFISITSVETWNYFTTFIVSYCRWLRGSFTSHTSTFHVNNRPCIHTNFEFQMFLNIVMRK